MAVIKLYGRERELGLLRRLREPFLAVVYGRRRVGKTALVLKFLEERSHLYFFVNPRKPSRLLLEEYGEALRRLGKTVIAVDLNPLSRTAQAASVTIVDNVTRAMPKLVETVKRLKSWDRERLLGILRSYDNGAVLADAVSHIAKRLTESPPLCPAAAVSWYRDYLERLAACTRCPRLVAYRESVKPPPRFRGETYWANVRGSVSAIFAVNVLHM
jgi:hypothetical protein